MRLGYRWAKAIWLICWAGAMTIVIFLPVVLAATFSRTGNLAFNLSQVWAWVLIRITGTKLEIRGRDRIEPDRSYVIISNHQSHFDA
ncbi:MAG: 1-acyl-sn-glycerol-3-phosphate acyltransferase, partial [Proteobacteria bacterium]|nr:1-acyl-sn-glycerol-3-phosphate acyltransferase [Pseudomonadota bacterium]